VIRIPNVTKDVTIAGAWIEKRDRLVNEAKAFAVVDSQAGFEAAGTLLKEMTRTLNDMEEKRLEMSRPFREAGSYLKEMVDRELKGMIVAKDQLNKLVNVYGYQQRQKEIAEAKRIEEENRKAVEKQIADNEAASLLGLDEKPVELPVAPVPAPEVPKSKDLAGRDEIVWEVVDEEAVPSTFKTLESKKVNGWIKTQTDLKKKIMDGKVIIPGLKFSVVFKCRWR